MYRMTRIIACFYALVLYLCLVGTAQSQTSDATLDDPSIFSSVDLKHELRLRYNVVDDEGFSNNANNLTLRLATALTASRCGWDRIKPRANFNGDRTQYALNIGTSEDRL